MNKYDRFKLIFIEGSMKQFYRWVLFTSLVLVFLNHTSKAQSHENNPKMAQFVVPSHEPLTGFLEGGYVSTLNVYQGEKISFYVSTYADPFTLKVSRYGAKEPMIEFTGLKGGVKEVKESDMVWEKGCNWTPVVKDFVIPENWRAGAYVAEFPVSSNQVTPIVFFVKERDPGKRSRILVMASTNTYAAYNQFGGKSIYDEFTSSSLPGSRASKITFHRPFNKNDHHGVNRGSFEAYDAKLIYWLESFGYGKDVDVVAQHDLEFDYAYLRSHDVLIDCGHDEYWSRGIREAIEKFVDAGKHFICLAGNTCWWQVRHPDQNTLVCYKSSQEDTEHPGDLLTTNNWCVILGGKNRENQLLGTSYEVGGYVNYGWTKDPPTPYSWLGWAAGFGGYAVHNAQHWVFNNTSLREGDIFGAKGDSSIVGYEADGAKFGYDEKGIPVPTGLDQTPMNFRILGISPVSLTKLKYDDPHPNQAATMGIYKRSVPGGGFVFNGATVRWVWGLYPTTSTVSKVTKNVLDQFLSGSCPPEFTSWSPSTMVHKKILVIDTVFNSKDKDLQFGKNLTLRAEAKGYNGEPVSYAWAVNDSIIPEVKGNSFIFRSVKYDFGENMVKAFAITGSDTASLSWKIKSVENALAITSVPDTVIRMGQSYKYSLSHYSKYNSQVSYSVNLLPKWAKFDPVTRTIEGIPNNKKDSVSITLTDSYGNKDTQNFSLREQETTYVRSAPAVISDFSLEQNYPNPFNNSTKIRFNVKDLSHAELVINDMLGKRIRTYSLGQVPSGSYEVSWDGADDLGLPVSSGVYVYNVTFSNAIAGKVNLSKKMIYMK